MTKEGSQDPNSPANVNVKETVHVFNAIAAQRETYVLVVLSPVSGGRGIDLSSGRKEQSLNSSSTPSLDSQEEKCIPGSSACIRYANLDEWPSSPRPGGLAIHNNDQFHRLERTACSQERQQQ